MHALLCVFVCVFNKFSAMVRIIILRIITAFEPTDSFAFTFSMAFAVDLDGLGI